MEEAEEVQEEEDLEGVGERQGVEEAVEEGLIGEGR